MSAAYPSSTDRLCSASYYFGLGPLIRFWRPDSSSLFLQHHFRQAMAAIFVAFIALLTTCIFEGAECLIAIKFPKLVQQLADRFGAFSWCFDDAELLLFAAVGLLWIILIGFAIAGSLRPMPLLEKISRNPFLVLFSFISNALAWVAVPTTIVFALWATSLTRTCAQGAQVYFLYDEGIAVPRWGYALGLSRLALQARWNWGAGSTVLDHLNRETLRTAFSCGKIVILATHGSGGCAATYFAPEVIGVWPADTGVTDETGSPHFLCLGSRGADDKWRKSETVKIDGQVQLVYIFACNAGKRAAQWQEHVAPAHVVTYDRFSTVLDHALWFAFSGPSEIKGLR